MQNYALIFVAEDLAYLSTFKLVFLAIAGPAQRER